MDILKEILSLSDWNIGKKENSPLIIAGPCSAESEIQMLTTAKSLKDIGIEVFRAGIWKPRTRPNCFEGIGSVGLKWMDTVRQETGMRISTEIANTKHLEQVLKHDIDIIWIGARTTTNPFAMQEIADALKGVDIPVFVKNPVNPDLELWIGALERLAQVGIKRLGAIHRGFSSYEQTKYRNIPQWQIPISLRERLKNIPLLCDPSHISGKRELIKEVSQEALDLNYDGLIIESHIDPSVALSDARQQVNPKDLEIILKELKMRNKDVNNQEMQSILSDLRTRIDKYDNQLLDILEERINIACEIGKIKREHDLKILQQDRWSSILSRVIREGKAKGISEATISKIFKAIHQESINKQVEIMKEEG